jgi:hypothetical protein
MIAAGDGRAVHRRLGGSHRSGLELARILGTFVRAGATEIDLPYST